MVRLQFLELAEQAVVLGVGDLRPCLDVIEAVVMVDEPTELCHAPELRGLAHRGLAEPAMCARV